MKRWQLAKQKGLNWQVVLIQDTETDIKLLTLESVKNGEDYGSINKKVQALIKDCINELESETLKQITKLTLSNFASRIYLQWLNIYGTRKQGLMVLLLLASKGVMVPEKTKTMLSSLPKESLGAIPTLANVKETPMLNNKNMPDYVYNRATANATYSLEYEKQVLSRVNQVLDQTAKEDYSARYSLRATAERQVRYEWQQERLKKLHESGIDLVWIDTHANCSERCQPWQGKLYSISGKSGVVDGISYRPLSDATDRYETTKAGKTYINGTLTGFNCRHTTTPYKKGNKPQYIPADVIERQRDIETQQRALERKIRFYETRALGWKKNSATSLTKQDKAFSQRQYQHNHSLVKKWQNEYIDFCRKNNIPHYPSRLKI